MTQLSHKTKFTAANKFFPKSGRLYFSIGMGILVDIYYGTQAAQADRALHCFSWSRASRKRAVVLVPTRNTMLMLTCRPSPPSQGVCVHREQFGQHGLHCLHQSFRTEHTAVPNTVFFSNQFSIQLQSLVCTAFAKT